MVSIKEKVKQRYKSYRHINWGLVLKFLTKMLSRYPQICFAFLITMHQNLSILATFEIDFQVQLNNVIKDHNQRITSNHDSLKQTDQQLQATENDMDDMKQRITSNEERLDVCEVGADKMEKLEQRHEDMKIMITSNVKQTEQRLDVCAEKTEKLEQRLNSMEEEIRVLKGTNQESAK